MKKVIQTQIFSCRIKFLSMTTQFNEIFNTYFAQMIFFKFKTNPNLNLSAVSSTWVQTSEYLTTNGRIKKMIVELLKPGRCEELYKLPNFDAPVWVTTGFNQSTMICSNAIDRHHFNCNPVSNFQDHV